MKENINYNLMFKQNKLDIGYYFIRTKHNNEVTIDYCNGGCNDWMENNIDDIIEVIAPINYDIYSQLNYEILALKCEMKECINVLLKVSPQHKQWIDLNFPNFKQ